MPAVGTFLTPFIMTTLRTYIRLILLLLVLAAPAFAQWEDSVLYNAYLKKDMNTWNRYLHANSFARMTEDEKIRYISYEYGYVATAIDEKLPDAKDHLDAFEAHINMLDTVIPPAQILAYRSSLAAYYALYNKFYFIGKGIESFKLVTQAYAIDSLDPEVITLKGNVDMHAPKAFGGDLKRALKEFELAKKIYEDNGLTHYNWNYISNWLCIAQCYERMGNVLRAIRTCEAILYAEPGFDYVRDVYLPELQSKYDKPKP